MIRKKAVKKEVIWGQADKPNLKIRNATKVEIDGIKFRSKLEAYTYRRLKEEGFKFLYEEITYTIIEKFEYMGEKIRPITITPDFIDPDKRIIIEVKGFSNELYPMRLKLFKRYLHMNRLEFQLYEVRTQRQVEELIINLKKDNV